MALAHVADASSWETTSTTTSCCLSPLVAAASRPLAYVPPTAGERRGVSMLSDVSTSLTAAVAATGVVPRGKITTESMFCSSEVLPGYNCRYLAPPPATTTNLAEAPATGAVASCACPQRTAATGDRPWSMPFNAEPPPRRSTSRASSSDSQFTSVTDRLPGGSPREFRTSRPVSVHRRRCDGDGHERPDDARAASPLPPDPRSALTFAREVQRQCSHPVVAPTTSTDDRLCPPYRMFDEDRPKEALESPRANGSGRSPHHALPPTRPPAEVTHEAHVKEVRRRHEALKAHYRRLLGSPPPPPPLVAGLAGVPQLGTALRFSMT